MNISWFSQHPQMLVINPILLKLLLVVFYFFLAWLASQFVPRLVQPAINSRIRLFTHRPFNERRVATLSGLIGDVLIFLFYLLAAIFALSLYVDSTGLFTFLGLFSAAFGLGARPLVSDYISGMIFLFEDLYTLGEKVEISGVEGTVEDLNMRTTYLRSPSGELYVIPNGEIRNVRNFARGTFSLGTVQVEVKTDQLAKATEVLNRVVIQAYEEISDLLEPPEIISEEGRMGTVTQFKIFAKARYGKGAAVRRRLLQFIHEALAAADVEMSG